MSGQKMKRFVLNNPSNATDLKENTTDQLQKQLVVHNGRRDLFLEAWKAQSSILYNHARRRRSFGDVTQNNLNQPKPQAMSDPPPANKRRRLLSTEEWGYRARLSYDIARNTDTLKPLLKNEHDKNSSKPLLENEREKRSSKPTSEVRKAMSSPRKKSSIAVSSIQASPPLLHRVVTRTGQFGRFATSQLPVQCHFGVEEHQSLVFIEGIAIGTAGDYVDNLIREHDVFPQFGRACELPHLVQHGSWSAALHDKNGNPVRLGPFHGTDKDLRGLHIVLRHQSASDVGPLRTKRKTRNYKGGTISVSLLDPSIGREDFITHHASVNEIDHSTAFFVGSLSIVAHDGFITSSDEVEEAPKLVKDVIAATKLELATSLKQASLPDLVSLSLPAMKTGGISFIRPIPCVHSSTAYHIVIAQDEQTEKIVGIDVAFHFSNPSPRVSLNSSSTESNLVELTANVLNLHSQFTDKFDVMEHHLKGNAGYQPFHEAIHGCQEDAGNGSLKENAGKSSSVVRYERKAASNYPSTPAEQRVRSGRKVQRHPTPGFLLADNDDDQEGALAFDSNDDGVPALPVNPGLARESLVPHQPAIDVRSREYGATLGENLPVADALVDRLNHAQSFAVIIHDGLFGVHDELTMVEATSFPSEDVSHEHEFAFHDALFGLADPDEPGGAVHHGSWQQWLASCILVGLVLGFALYILGLLSTSEQQWHKASFDEAQVVVVDSSHGYDL